MLKTLGAQIKEYKWASIATPVFMLLEVAVDTIIPLLMASIIDNGVNMVQRPPWALERICVLQCFATSRPFPLQISTDSHPRVLSHV